MKTVNLPNNVFIPQIKELIDEGHTATFNVRGFSMRIFVENQRDKVLLGPCNEMPKVGDVILARAYMRARTAKDTTQDVPHYVLHRVIRIEGEHIILRGDGNISGTEVCKQQDIVGRALGFYRKGRKTPDLVTSFKWRTYSRIWLILTPIRRWILAFYHHIWLRIFPIKLK